MVNRECRRSDLGEISIVTYSDRECVLRDVGIERLESLAVALVNTLPLRVVIGLRGTLGAGKTRLAQAIAVASGIDQQQVTSPTFTIVQHYQGTRLIHHIDAYRLADEDEFIELGGEELLEEEATILIEWPERIAQCMPKDVLYIDLKVQDDPDLRTVFATSLDGALIQRVRTAFGAVDH